MKKLYNQKEVSKLIGISENQVRYWDKTGLIGHVEKAKGHVLFDFKGLVAFRTVKELLKKGFSTRKIRKCIAKLKLTLPEVEQPFTELRMAIQGEKIIIGKDNLKFTPEGQILMNFDQTTKTTLPLPVDKTEELFFQALEYEEQGDWTHAKKKYESVLTLKPDHADALVNLGNIMHGQGNAESAQECYRKALRADPNHVEANYNFANLLEEEDKLDDAILFYFKSTYEDPEFADAQFNLGRALERAGEIEEAKKHWRIYLALDPASKWAEHVRERLQELERHS